MRQQHQHQSSDQYENYPGAQDIGQLIHTDVAREECPDRAEQRNKAGLRGLRHL